MQSFAGECDGLKNFLVCFFSVFNYGHVMTSISDMGVNFKFGASKKPGNFVLPGFIISRFCSVHFTVTLAVLRVLFVYPRTLL